MGQFTRTKVLGIRNALGFLQKLGPQYEAFHLFVAAIHFISVVGEADALDHGAAFQRDAARTFDLEIFYESHVVTVFQFGAVGIARNVRHLVLSKNGDPGMIRTCDPRIRNPLL